MDEQLFESLKEESVSPRPFGLGAALFFTLGLLLLQVFIFGIIIFIVKVSGAPEKPAMIAMMILGSLIWVAASLFLQRALRLPPKVLNLSLSGLSYKPILLLIPFAFFIQLTGAHFDSIIMRFRAAQPSSLEQFQDLALNYPLAIIPILFLTVVVAPLSEEMFFRGTLLRGLKLKGYGFAIAGTYTSLIFAIVHLQIVGLVTLFSVGLSCAWLSHKSRSLLPSMILHGIYNAMVMGFSFSLFFRAEPMFYRFDQPLPPRPSPDLPALWVNIVVGIFSAAISVGLLKLITAQLMRGEGSTRKAPPSPASTSEMHA